MIIAIEGCEGSGKGTVIKRLKENLGANYRFFREPGGTVFSEKIRDLIFHSEITPETEFLLFLTARVELWKKIREVEKKGKTIILDRSVFSTLAYQGEHLPLDRMISIHESLGNFFPDFTIFLDTPPEIGLKRIKENNRETNSFDLRELDYHRRVYNRYKEVFLNYPSVMINGDQSEKQVFEEVFTEIKKRP